MIVSGGPRPAPQFTIKEAGDSALLLQFEPVIDAAVNARAVGMAAAIRSRQVPGVRDVIPTYRSVAVHFDPLATDVDLVRSLLSDTPVTSSSIPSGTLVEVPVVYGEIGRAHV